MNNIANQLANFIKMKPIPILILVLFSALFVQKYEVKTGSFSLESNALLEVIKAKLEVNSEKIDFSPNFAMLLAKYRITIPRVVNQKIAQEIPVKSKPIHL